MRDALLCSCNKRRHPAVINTAEGRIVKILSSKFSVKSKSLRELAGPKAWSPAGPPMKLPFAMAAGYNRSKTNLHEKECAEE